MSAENDKADTEFESLEQLFVPFQTQSKTQKQCTVSPFLNLVLIPQMCLIILNFLNKHCGLWDRVGIPK